MSTYDAPNQQVVRADGSAPWEEGNGGSSNTPTPGPRGAKTAKEEAKPKPENQGG
jgi:hypothetical protein